MARATSRPLTVVHRDTLPFEERAARVLGAASLPPLPTPADEAWHYTNLRGVAALTPARAADYELAEVARALPVVDGPQVVVVNGRVAPQLSLLDGLAGGVAVEWQGVHTPLPCATPLCAWHAAQGGHVVEVTCDAGEALLNVITVLAGHDVPCGGTVKVRVATGARLTLVEHVVGTLDAQGWLNDRLVVEVEAGGYFDHVLVQDVPQACFVTRRQDTALADTASYRAHSVQVGATLARLENHLTCGTSSNLKLTGLTLTDNDQLHDTTVRVNHMDVATESHIRQRNILRGERGHAVFQGKFYVAQKAQKTNAYMLCESLLLADGARVSAKPELEIYADDVKCSHGASTGRLQPDQLFYLAARGLDDTTARRLLVAAFAEALLDDVPAVAQPLLQRRVGEWLDGKERQLPVTDEDINTDWLDDPA